MMLVRKKTITWKINSSSSGFIRIYNDTRATGNTIDHSRLLLLLMIIVNKIDKNLSGRKLSINSTHISYQAREGVVVFFFNLLLRKQI